MQEQIFSGALVNGTPELIAERDLPDNPRLLKIEAAMATLRSVAASGQGPADQVARALLDLLEA